MRKRKNSQTVQKQRKIRNIYRYMVTNKGPHTKEKLAQVAGCKVARIPYYIYDLRKSLKENDSQYSVGTAHGYGYTMDDVKLQNRLYVQKGQGAEYLTGLRRLIYRFVCEYGYIDVTAVNLLVSSGGSAKTNIFDLTSVDGLLVAQRFGRKAIYRCVGAEPLQALKDWDDIKEDVYEAAVAWIGQEVA